MVNAKTAVQLYSLKDVDGSFSRILNEVADAGFDGVEFAYRVTETDPDTIVTSLEETGLQVAGAHVGLDALENNIEETVEFYQTLGCEDFIVPWLDAENFECKESVIAAVDRLKAIEDKLAEHGVNLHYHNHHHEFVSINNETGFDIFVDESDFGIELDFGLALLGGDEPVSRLKELNGRTSLVHLKDVDIDDGESVPLGDGDLNIGACINSFDAINGEWLIYEYEGESPLETLDQAVETIHRYSTI